MSAPRKSAHLASIRLRSASTRMAPERSARCSVERNRLDAVRSAFFRMARSSLERLRSRSESFCPDRSQATQVFALPPRNAATSSGPAAATVANASTPTAIQPGLIPIARSLLASSPGRRALDRLELGIITCRRGRRKARQRLQPFDDRGVVGPVAERVLGRGPGIAGRLDERGTRIDRGGETGGERDVAAENAEAQP